MNDKIVDLTEWNNGNENPPEAIVIQTLGKFDVDFEEIRREVNILDFRIIKSQEKDRSSIFEEFESVSYKILFTTYNVEFFIRLLSFHNDILCQILKLDIELKTTNIKKEIEYCLNSLQRRRNLDLMFKTLILFGKFIESRRLICDLILKKNSKVKIEQNADGGIIIVYSDEPRNVRLGIFWSIACSSTHDITDVIEVYYKVVELPYKKDIKYTLNKLTEPCLDFAKKYHLWKSLIDDLSERRLIIKIDKMLNDTTTNREAEPITILSDSEDTFGKTLVTDVDKVPNQSILKHPEGRPLSKDQNIKESARSLVVEVDIMPDSWATKDVISKCHELQDQAVTVISDSEGTFGKTLVTDVDKVPNQSILKHPEGGPSSKNQNIKESGRSLVVEIDIMPDSSVRKDVISKCHELQDQTVTVLSDSEESTRKSLVEVEKKLDNSTASHDITQEVQKLEEIYRKSVVVVVDKMPATSSTDSQNEERARTECTKKNRDTDILSYLQLEKTSNKEKLKGENNNFVIRRRLRTGIRQISKSKGAELESSDSEIHSGILKVRNKTGTISVHSDSGSSDSAKCNDSEDSEDSDSSESSVSEYECSSDASVQTKLSAEQRRKKQKIRLDNSRKSSRLSTISNTQNSSNLGSPSRKSSVYNTRGKDTTPRLKAQLSLKTPERRVYSDCSNSSTPVPKRDVATSTASPNRGLILLSDSSLVRSVLPNNLLNVITPGKAQATSTPQKNIRIRLVPEKPVSDSPSFVELNLFSPSKKPKITDDDDLEITSVTYIIPD